MKEVGFMKSDFLLNTDTAKRIYQEYASQLPVIDYHNHLSVDDIKENRRFFDIYELWIQPDPYKHRAMRMCGVEEKYITGNATNEEKFCAWCEVLPDLLGNPLYHWTVMELYMVFGIEEIPDKNNAMVLYKKLNQYLKDNIISTETLMKMFNVEIACPCVSLIDEFDCFKDNKRFSPSLRGDDIVKLDINFVKKLGKTTGMKIKCLDDLKKAVSARLDSIAKVGCCFTDHALDNGFIYYEDDKNNDARFAEILKGEKLEEKDAEKLFSCLLLFLGEEYAKRDLVMQLHIGAQRFTSTRLRSIAGAAGGFAGIGNSVDIKSLTKFLDDLEKTDHGLPKTVLFTLNPADNAMISVLSGSYSKDKVKGLITQGPAWWWCDHKQGIWQMLDNNAVFGVLSNFIGMTTDSRSFLSFVRHDYFRRILCDWLGSKVEACEFDDDVSLQRLVNQMCYKNAKNCVK